MSVQAPHLKVPYGYSVVETKDGYEVVANGETLSRTIAFRLPASLYADLADLVETFPERSWAAAMRWLVSDSSVNEIISARIASQTKRVAPR